MSQIPGPAGGTPQRQVCSPLCPQDPNSIESHVSEQLCALHCPPSLPCQSLQLVFPVVTPKATSHSLNPALGSAFGGPRLSVPRAGPGLTVKSKCFLKPCSPLPLGSSLCHFLPGLQNQLPALILSKPSPIIHPVMAFPSLKPFSGAHVCRTSPKSSILTAPKAPCRPPPAAVHTQVPPGSPRAGGVTLHGTFQSVPAACCTFPLSRN